MKTSVTFQNTLQPQNSPKFLHISQINKIFSSPNQQKRSLSPFSTPQSHPSTRRPYSQHKNTPSKEQYIPNYSELALSAKDYVDELRRKEQDEFNEIDHVYRNKLQSFPSIQDKKKSFVSKKSRVSQILSRKPSPFLPFDSSEQEVSLNYSENGVYDSLILFDNSAEQGDVVWRYLTGREESPETKDIYKEWVQGLTKEERGNDLYHKTIKIYGWRPRILSKQKLENDMEKMYGNGQNRRLRPGEEAAILENIRAILEKCETNPDFFQYSVHTAIRKILKKANLQELVAFPTCLKQTEIHWKIMATRFRCSGKPFLQTKKFDKMLGSSQCKMHFLNLENNKNILVKYLLRHSCRRLADW